MLMRTLIFISSFAAAAIAFGLILTPALAFFLVLLVLFHEAGHLAAMKLFGYRDTRILFIPLVGAVTMGRKGEARPHERIIVYLAGPVPGMVLGSILIGTSPAPDHLQSHIGMAALLLNYLNLLPFLPFDGGKVLRVLLYDRLPLMEPMISVGGVIALMMSCLLLGDWWPLVPALMLTVAIPGQYREARRLERLILLQPPMQDAEAQESAAREMLGEAPEAALSPRAEVLLARFRALKADTTQTLAYSLLYAALLAMPLLHRDQIVQTVEQVFPQPQFDNWEARINAAPTRPLRWEVLYEAARAVPDTQRAAYYAAKAAAESRAFGERDTRLHLSLLYQVHFLNPQKGRAQINEVTDIWQRIGLPKQDRVGILETAAGMRADAGAVLLMDAAIEHVERYLGTQHPALAANLITRSWYRETSDPGAINDLERALEILKQKFAEDSLEVLDVTTRLAGAYCRQGHQDHALRLLDQVLDDMVEPTRERYTTLSEMFALRGYIAALQKQWNKAEAAYAQVLHLQKDIYGLDADLLPITTLLDLAVVSKRSGDNTRAEELVEQVRNRPSVRSAGGLKRFLDRELAPERFSGAPWSLPALFAPQRVRDYATL